MPEIFYFLITPITLGIIGFISVHFMDRDVMKKNKEDL